MNVMGERRSSNAPVAERVERRLRDAEKSK
jgi:hypothetical protein